MIYRLPLLALAALLCTVTASPAAAFKRTAMGEDLKEFRLETPAGEPVSLTESRGEKVTVVVFWATWNPRSTQLLGDLQPLYAEHGAGGLQIVAINTENGEWDPATLDKVAETVAATGAAFPVVIDRDLSVYDQYGVIALPSAVLADGEGKIFALQQGYPTAARLELKEKVLVALGVMEPPAEELAEVPRERLVDPKVRRQVEMARLLLKKRRPSRAVKVVNQAIEQDPTYAEAYRVLAEVLDALEQPDEATAARARVAELEQPVEAAAAVGQPTAATAEGAQ